MKRSIILASVLALASLAPFSASASMTLFNGSPSDYVGQYSTALSNDMSPYSSQVYVQSSYNTWPLPAASYFVAAGDNYTFFFNSGASAGTRQANLSASTVNRLCYLVDPTATGSVQAADTNWTGTSGKGKLYAYTPTAVGYLPAGWNAQDPNNNDGCPSNGDACHYGLRFFTCSTAAPPGQTLSINTTSITLGQSATLSWVDSPARDTMWVPDNSHLPYSYGFYLPPSPPDSCTTSGFTIPPTNQTRTVCNHWSSVSSCGGALNLAQPGQSTLAAAALSGSGASSAATGRELAAIGGTCTYSWACKYTSGGNASQALPVPNAGPGTTTVTPTAPGTYTYSYNCTNANGTTNRSVTLTVNPAAPTCAANSGQACSKTSAANSCGQTTTTTGTYDCNGVCTAATPSTPSNPAGYGSACSSSANVCGQTNAGTIQCNGSCSASAPANPSGYGATCYSGYNSCGQRNTGSVQCNGSCSAGTPSNNSCPAASASISVSPSPVDQWQHYTVAWSCTNSSSASVWWQDNNGGWHESWPSEPATGSLTDWTTYNTQYEVDCHAYNGNMYAAHTWQTINAPRLSVSESPNPVAYGAAPKIGFSSVNANYCYVAVDGNVFAQGYFTGGTFTGPSNLSPGSHVGEVYCYNPNWLGSGWVGQNFTVSPPPPTVSLSANPTVLNEGYSSTLTWSSTYANSCTGTGFSTGGATSGNTSTGALNTPGQENYEVTCSNSTGSTNAFASVTVRSPQAQISASPSRVTSGGSISVTWTASGIDS